MPVKLFIIVACCENFGIGFNGTTPWNLKGHQEYYRNLTMGNPPYNKLNAVIMGRKTYVSLPHRPRRQEGRVNIVLSTDIYTLVKVAKTNIYMCDSSKSLINLLNTTFSHFVHIAWVTGGASMFQWALNQPYCERIYMTWIKKKFECDTFFPRIPKKFVKIEDNSVPRGEHQEGDIKYEYRVYENILFHNSTAGKLTEEDRKGAPSSWLFRIESGVLDSLSPINLITTNTRHRFLPPRRFWEK